MFFQKSILGSLGRVSFALSLGFLSTSLASVDARADFNSQCKLARKAGATGYFCCANNSPNWSKVRFQNQAYACKTTTLSELGNSCAASSRRAFKCDPTVQEVADLSVTAPRETPLAPSVRNTQPAQSPSARRMELSQLPTQLGTGSTPSRTDASLNKNSNSRDSNGRSQNTSGTSNTSAVNAELQGLGNSDGNSDPQSEGATGLSGVRNAMDQKFKSAELPELDTSGVKRRIETADRQGEMVDKTLNLTPRVIGSGTTNASPRLQLADGSSSRNSTTGAARSSEQNGQSNYAQESARDAAKRERDLKNLEDEERELKRKSAESYVITDDCSISGALGAKPRCRTTQIAVDAAKITNQATQVGGSLVVGVSAQSNVQAAAQEGTLSASYEAAAASADKAAKVQTVVGGVNSILGGYQQYRAIQHNRAAGQIQRDQAGKKIEEKMLTSGDAQFQSFQEGVQRYDAAIADAARLGQPTATLIEAKNQYVSKSTNAAATAGIKEQKSQGSDAQMGAFTSMVEGVKQFMGAKTNRDYAKTMRNAAKTLKEVENPGQVPGFDPFPLPSSGPYNPSLPNVGNGDTSPISAEDGLADSGDVGEEGSPLGIPAPDISGGDGGLAAGPAPGMPGGGAGGMPMNQGMGGGMPMGGGGGGYAPEGNTEAGEPVAAGNSTAPYSPGGGTYSSGGGRGGGGASGDVGMPGFKDLLAQFLPGAEQGGPQNSILDYGAGGRGLASTGSLLDRNADLFQRIHETYQQKHKAGNIGP